MPRKRVAILISGRGSNMRALIAVAAAHDYPAEIALVLSNRPDAPGLALAREAGTPTAVLDHRPFGKDRPAFERALQSLLDEHRIELVCLGGFMRLFTADFVLRWQGRMLNIHPALLPSFKGLDPHGQALRAGVKIAGATVHFVTPEMDSGPIVAQAAVPVLDGDTAETLAARVLAVEHRLYPMALRLIAEDQVRIEDGRCIVAGVAPADEEASLIVPADTHTATKEKPPA
jgi:phosphoribosylglycinamide formyltransferase-1